MTVGQVAHRHVLLSLRIISWIPVKGRDSPTPGKVTVGLASHWPWVTDFSGLLTYGFKGDEDTPRGSLHKRSSVPSVKRMVIDEKGCNYSSYCGQCFVLSSSFLPLLIGCHEGQPACKKPVPIPVASVLKHRQEDTDVQQGNLGSVWKRGRLIGGDQWRRNREFMRFSESGPRAPGDPKSGAEKFYARKEYATSEKLRTQKASKPLVLAAYTASQTR